MFVRTIWLWLLCWLIPITIGCGGGGNNSTTTPAGKVPAGPIVIPVTPDGRLILRYITLNPAISQVRLRGLDAGGRVILGPLLLTRAPELSINDIPKEVVQIAVEYLENGIVVGVFTATLDFSGGRTVTLVDPSFTPIRALVEISVEPANLVVPLGFRSRLRATGRYSDQTYTDLSLSVSWSAQPPGVLEIGADGSVRGLSSGTASVRAELAELSGQAQLQVEQIPLQSITISPNPAQVLAGGGRRSFTAEGEFVNGGSLDVTADVEWSSSSQSVFTVVSPGLIEGVGVGTAQVLAKSGLVEGSSDVHCVPARVEIGESQPGMLAGDVRQLAAVGILQDGSRVELFDGVNWSSDGPGVVEVNSRGVALANAAGACNITASVADTSASATMSVTAPRRFVYIPSRYGTVSGFELNAANGSLTPLAGSPYLVEAGTPTGITGTPDGSKVFVTGPGAVRTFFRDSNTGELTRGPRDLSFSVDRARVDPTGEFLVSSDSNLERVRVLRILDDGTFEPVTQAISRLTRNFAIQSVENFYLFAGLTAPVSRNLHAFQLGDGPSLELRSSLSVSESEINDLSYFRFRGRHLFAATSSDSGPNIGIVHLDSNGELSLHGPLAKYRRTVAPRTADLVVTRVGPRLAVGGFSGASNNVEVYDLGAKGTLAANAMPAENLTLVSGTTRLHTIPGSRYVLVNVGNAGDNLFIFDFLEGPGQLVWSGSDIGGNLSISGLYHYAEPVR